MVSFFLYDSFKLGPLWWCYLLQSCLSVLGIPFLDVVRVLAAVLLLGNVQFADRVGNTSELDLKGGSEIKSVAALLGLSSVALFQGLTSRTRSVRGQLVKAASDAVLVSTDLPFQCGELVPF